MSRAMIQGNTCVRLQTSKLTWQYQIASVEPDRLKTLVHPFSVVTRFGEDVTKATLQCLGKGGVYGESLQPDSLEKIRKLEQMAPATKPSVTEAMEPPKFVTHLSDVTRLIEGQSAHFEGRLTPVNDPNLVVGTQSICLFLLIGYFM